VQPLVADEIAALSTRVTGSLVQGLFPCRRGDAAGSLARLPSTACPPAQAPVPTDTTASAGGVGKIAHASKARGAAVRL
jgi:hypothetical protein